MIIDMRVLCGHPDSGTRVPFARRPDLHKISPVNPSMILVPMKRIRFAAQKLQLSTAFLLSVCISSVVIAEPFEKITIGDADGFGFSKVKGLIRPSHNAEVLPADVNGNGKLEPKEFVPDLNGDGAVWYAGADNFDNRSLSERLNKGHACRGCLSVGKDTKGSNWTDLSLSTTSPNINWPDTNGPAVPNNATFNFDFTVENGTIAKGSQIFFNLVYADYDVDPAVIKVKFLSGKEKLLTLENSRYFGFDGLIEARTTFLPFDDVFTLTDDGHWRGFAQVVFDAPFEPWTAFDFVELSLVGLS